VLHHANLSRLPFGTDHQILREDLQTVLSIWDSSARRRLERGSGCLHCEAASLTAQGRISGDADGWATLTSSTLNPSSFQGWKLCGSFQGWKLCGTERGPGSGWRQAGVWASPLKHHNHLLTW